MTLRDRRFFVLVRLPSSVLSSSDLDDLSGEGQLTDAIGTSMRIHRSRWTSWELGEWMLGEWMLPSARFLSGRKIVRISDLDWSRMDADRVREFDQVSRFHRWLIDRSRGLAAEAWRPGSAAFVVDRRIDQMMALGWARVPDRGLRSRLVEGEVAVRVPAFSRSWCEAEGEILVESARLVYARDVIADGSDAAMGCASLALVPLLSHCVLDAGMGRWLDPDEALGFLGYREGGDGMSASVAHAIRADACLRGGDVTDLLVSVLCHVEPGIDVVESGRQA